MVVGELQQALQAVSGTSVMTRSLDDDAPAWVQTLRDRLEEQLGYYDQTVEFFVCESLSRMQSFVEKDETIRMPPIQPVQDIEAVNQWYDHSETDRSRYLKQGRDSYYDRLSLSTEDGRKKAKQVGMQMEYRTVYRAAYNILKDEGIVEKQTTKEEEVEN